MYVQHLALGGCLSAPPIRFGITEDTGGHLAYLLGAALAQASLATVERIDLVTRAFDEPSLGAVHTEATERIDDILSIRRLVGGGSGYLEKQDLEAALPELTTSFLDLLSSGERPDVIHAHFADAAELALAARERYGIPVIYTPHSLALGKRECGLDSPALNRRIERERRAIAECDAIIVSSRDEAERQLVDYGVEVAGRTHRISPGAYLAIDAVHTRDAEQLIDPSLDEPDRPLILAIARPVAKKNLGGLLTAYAKTPGLREAANLAIIAGLHEEASCDGSEQQRVIGELKDGIDRLGLTGSVALPAHHEPRHIAQLYRLAARRGGVFVNPALHEPFGLTLLEAAEHDLPVVATNCGGPRDILADLGHGTLVAPRDPVALGQAVHDIVTDRGHRARFTRALAKGLGDYVWPTYAQRSLQLYGQLTARSRTSLGRTGGVRTRAASRLLVCDMDGTLTGSRSGVRRFAAAIKDLQLPFVVSTGRSLPEARRILAKWELPVPDAYVTAVGTEIHLPYGGGRARLAAGYARAIGRRWDREAVRSVLLAGRATWQRDVEQRLWKLGLFGDVTEAERLRDLLHVAGIGATVTQSHDHLIDVTPPRVDKSSAMAWLARHWGLTLADCIACGDSGNDTAMLRAAGVAVVVANALPELGALTGPHVLRTRSPHAAGVAEALDRLGLTAESGTALAVAA